MRAKANKTSYWDDWVLKPGKPPAKNTTDFSTSNDQKLAEALADDYIARRGMSKPANFEDYNKWYSN